MKLSQNTVKLILEATKLANMLNIEGLILDDTGIRGYNNTDGLIVASLGDHGFEFDSLGIARLGSLKHKAALLRDLNLVNVEAVQKSGKPDVIEKLIFDCGKIKFEFRCALVRGIIDIPSTKMKIDPIFHFDITEDDVANMTQGISAMRSKEMTITGNGSDVNFLFNDDTGDILNLTIDSDLTSIGPKSEVSLIVNLKVMAPIMKLAAQAGTFTLNILKNNIVHIAIGNMDVIVMPEV